MSAAAAVQLGVEPFVSPDLFMLPAEIPFGLSAAEFAFCLDPRGSPLLRMAPDLAWFRGDNFREPIVLSAPWPWLSGCSCLFCYSIEHRSSEHRSLFRRDKMGQVIRSAAASRRFSSLTPDVKYKGEGFVFEDERIGNQHGLIDWISRNDAIGTDALHREELAEQEKLRSGLGNNTSRPWTPVREWSAIQRLLKLAHNSSSLVIAEEVCDEEGREQDYIEGHDDNERSGAEQPAFIEGTSRTFVRGSREPDTEETRAAYAAEKARLDGIIKEANLWSPLDPPEHTRTVNGRKVNTKNKNFLQIAFDLARLEGNHDGQKELAEELGLKHETARKKELPMINKDKPFPTTPLPADDRLAALMGEDLGGRVYVHVTLDRGRWYPLDMEKHDTYAAAIEEVRWRSQDEAWKKARVPSRLTDTRTPEDDPALARAFKEVLVRYEEAFNPKNLFVLDLRSPTARAIAEAEWGTVDQFRAIGEGGEQ